MNKKDEMKATIIIGLLMLAVVYITGCASQPKTAPVTLSCYAEQTYDFIEKQGGKNYWAEMVTPKTLESCRQNNYQKHTAHLTPEEIKQANDWVTSKLTNNKSAR